MNFNIFSLRIFFENGYKLDEQLLGVMIVFSKHDQWKYERYSPVLNTYTLTVNPAFF